MKIIVDGLVGPKTWSMIEAYRMAGAGAIGDGVGVDGTETAPPVSKPKPKRGKILYVHDAGLFDAGRMFGRHTMRAGKGDVLHIKIPKKQSFDKVMDTIVSTIGKYPLELLILNAHGNSASISIGETFGPKDMHHFRRLWPIFQKTRCPKQGTEIHSCYFAAMKSTG